jgi:hypothetical protein
VSDFEEVFSDTGVTTRSYLTEKADIAASQNTRSTTPLLALDIKETPIGKPPPESNTPPLIPFKFPKEQKKHIPNWKKTPNQLTKPKSVKYHRIAKDIVSIQKNSKQTSYYCKPYSDILRNQLVRAHSHSLLELVLKFEDYRKRTPQNKDPTWFLEKASIDLFLFSDELQGVSNLPQATRLIIATDFEELAQPASVGPFVGFTDPRDIIKRYSKRSLY